jgi:hypothetical protein
LDALEKPRNAVKVSDSNRSLFSGTIGSAVRLYFEPLQWLGRLLSIGLNELVDGVLPGLRQTAKKRDDSAVSSKTEFVASERKPETATYAEMQKCIEELLLKHGRVTQDATEKIVSSTLLLERLREDIVRIESQSLSHSADILLADARAWSKISEGTPLLPRKDAPVGGPPHMTLSGDILSEPMLDLVQLATPASVVYVGAVDARRIGLNRRVDSLVRFISSDLGSEYLEADERAKLNQAIQILNNISSGSHREHTRSLLGHPLSLGDTLYSVWEAHPGPNVESTQTPNTQFVKRGAVLGKLYGRQWRKVTDKPIATEPDAASDETTETAK